MANSRYDIVIVGGNLSGVAVAHYLLKHTLPALRKLDAQRSFQVTIVTPSSHYFWKISAPRIMVKGTEESYNQVFRPLAQGFAKYGDAFTLVQGVAVSTDSAARSVVVKKNDGTEHSLHYDSLVIATGAASTSPLWTLHGDHNTSLDAMKTTKEKLATAKTVLIAGGGAVGVESAGEIMTTFPAAKITLLSGTDRLLVRSSPGVSKSAEQKLTTAGVEVIHHLKTQNTETTADGQTKVSLSNGTERLVDVYIDGTGGSLNSDWVPAEWLNDKKQVKVDKNYLRVLGANAERVYAIGDVADYSAQAWADIDFAAGPMSHAIGADIVPTLNDGKGASTGIIGTLLSYIPGFGSVLSLKKVSPPKGIFLIPIGPSDGVGTLLGVSVPAFLISFIKGKTFFLEMTQAQWNGDAR